MDFKKLKKIMFATVKAEAPRFLIGWGASTQYMTTGKFPEWTPRRNTIETKKNIGNIKTVNVDNPSDFPAEISKNETWNCAYCGFLNSANEYQCYHCGAGRKDR